MNPGIQANIIAIVCAILVLTGWGAKTLEDGRAKARLTGFFLLLFVVATVWELPGPRGTHWNVGGLLLPLALTVWTWRATPHWSLRLQWLIGTATVTSSLVILMTLVPLDPAFFLVEPSLLYPLSAVVIAVCSVRRPFPALTIAVTGMLLASLIDPLLHGKLDWSEITIAGGDVRDSMAFIAGGVLLLHGPYHAAARFVLRLFRGRLRPQQQPEGGPEHA